jgi:hypothetical protein
VLARRIREGALTESRALDVAAMLLYDNPKRLYGLAWDEPGSLAYA